MFDFVFFFQAEDGIRDLYVTGVQTCALPILLSACSNIRVEDEREMSAMPPTAPKVIYVKDFDLAPGRFQAESGILPISPISAGVPGAFIPRILGVRSEERRVGKEFSCRWAA